MALGKQWIKRSEQRLITRVLVDFVVLLLYAAVIPLFYLKALPPFRRGYFCDDDTIRYPYRESTVSDNVLYVICLSIPPVLIFICELSQHSVVELNPTSSEVILFKWRIPTNLQRMVTSKVLFVFGAFATGVLTNTIKLLVGRLRPNFLSVCRSDFDCINALDSHFYVQEYECSNEDIESVRNARLSFPSGHSSIATYTMLFAIVLLFLVGAYISLSRIQDHKHHWSDVVGGIVFGVVSCLWVVCIYSRLLGKAPNLESFKVETQRDIFTMEPVEIRRN